MTQEPRHRFSDLSMSEWVERTSKGLDDDVGVGIVGILDTARDGFGLEGEALVDFVRKSLRTLVKAGARPWHWGTFGDTERHHALHYGNDTNDEIVEGVIADWLASGGGDLEWGDFRFILPEFTEHK